MSIEFKPCNINVIIVLLARIFQFFSTFIVRVLTIYNLFTNLCFFLNIFAVKCSRSKGKESRNDFRVPKNK